MESTKHPCREPRWYGYLLDHSWGPWETSEEYGTQEHRRCARCEAVMFAPVKRTTNEKVQAD